MTERNLAMIMGPNILHKEVKVRMSLQTTRQASSEQGGI